MQSQGEPRRYDGETRTNRLRDVVIALNFHPRPWAPDGLPETIRVEIRCLLSKSPREKFLVVDGAYPLVRLPGGISCSGYDPHIPKRAFRAALLEALREQFKPDLISPIKYEVIDWEGGMLDE